MSQSEIGFRTAALGFRREDVLEFIAQEAKRRQEIKEQLEQIQEEAAQLRQESEEANRASKTLLASHDESLAELRKKDEKIKALQEELAQAKNEIKQAKQEQDILHSEYEALEKTLEETKTENAALLSKCGEYDEARGKLADIELCAHGRAEEIERRAEQQACELIEEAERMAEQLLQTIAQTKEAFWEALDTAEQETERAHARTMDALTEFDGIMEELRSRVATQVAPEPEQETQTALQENDTQEAEQPVQEHTQAASDYKEYCAGRERPTLAQVLGALRGGK